MTPYLQIYLKHFDFTEYDVWCEKCGSKASEIHHINGRGKDKNCINNLIALCRNCHTFAHSSKNYISKQEFQTIHDNFLKRKTL